MYNLFGKTDFVSLNEVLYTVERKSMEYNSLSFTFLHWSLMEQISNNQINIDEINEN